MNSAYTPTLLERLLGKHYKWWYVIQFEQKIAFINRWNIFIIILRFLIPLTVTYIIIANVSNGTSNQEYLILASLLYQFYAFAIGPSHDLTNLVVNGNIAKHLLRPTNYWSHIFWRIIGYNSFPLSVRLIIFSLTMMVLRININFDLNLALVFLYLPIIVFLALQVEKIIGSVSFFNLQGNKTFLPFVHDTLPFVTGSLISFSLLGGSFGFLKYTPFAYVAYQPMQIYLGYYNANQIILTFLIAIMWSMVLFVTANAIYSLGLKRNESVGL